MEYVPKEYRGRIAPLFAGWEETLLWSCLQGHMGQAWADSLARPASAKIVIADFCFLAGVPSDELAAHKPQDGARGWVVVPQNEEWARCVERVYAGCNRRITRYAFYKTTQGFDRERLLEFVGRLPCGYSLKPIDEALYRQTQQEIWAHDLCSQFADYCDYAARGRGYAVVHDGRLVCGASSYTVYSGGIEIEIDTKPDHRRRGLARACAARLMLDCLDAGLYPSWDAANLASVALAKQLGYRFKEEYAAYEVLFPAPSENKTA